MGDASDRYEILERARETLRRVDDAERRRRFEEQQQYAGDEVCAVEAVPLKWDATNPRKRTVATMTQREFAAWCAAGRPPLVEKSLPRPQPRNNAMDLDQVHKYVSDRLVEFAELLGAETGRNEKALRTEIAALRAEIHTLRRELDSGVLELPGPSPRDWRHAATH